MNLFMIKIRGARVQVSIYIDFRYAGVSTVLDGAVGLCLIRFANAIYIDLPAFHLGELYNRHIIQLSGYEAYCPRVV